MKYDWFLGGGLIGTMFGLVIAGAATPEVALFLVAFEVAFFFGVKQSMDI